MGEEGQAARIIKGGLEMQLVEMQGQMIELQALLLQKIESYYLDTPESTKQEDKFVREILLLEGKANRLKSRIEKELKKWKQ